jgi:hypothetical protein
MRRWMMGSLVRLGAATKFKVFKVLIVSSICSTEASVLSEWDMSNRKDVGSPLIFD